VCLESGPGKRCAVLEEDVLSHGDRGKAGIQMPSQLLRSKRSAAFHRLPAVDFVEDRTIGCKQCVLGSLPVVVALVSGHDTGGTGFTRYAAVCGVGASTVDPITVAIRAGIRKSGLDNLDCPSHYSGSEAAF